MYLPSPYLGLDVLWATFKCLADHLKPTDDRIRTTALDNAVYDLFKIVTYESYDLNVFNSVTCLRNISILRSVISSSQANAERRKLQTQMLDASTRTTQMTQIRKVVNMLRQMQRGTDYSNSSLRGAFEHCRLPTSSPLTSISATRAARSEHPRYTQSEHAS
ncbi:hypothetical protein M8J77_018261 [Diaphorina citri]|nr:hypothetical protein M8J77_018261 [Diaphorina citri]